MKGAAWMGLLAAWPLACAAGESRTTFLVTAQVTPRVSLETLSEPAQFAVSEADAARGYVDVTATYQVRNNDPAGYVLRLEPRVGYASGVVVTGIAAPVTLFDETVEVIAPAALSTRMLTLTFRVALPLAAGAGDYPLPLRISAATL
ncbi:MAG TPA: hypothetical protein PL152_03330 [Steroidobacteraceae bacterium]|nr:hypothetical protein [Steroidobacteraceae bacterium]HQR48339.1 hypothetical protein [Steroidobacteraceae bacterium]